MGAFETELQAHQRTERHILTLNPSEARICELTGFLEFKGDPFTPKNKSIFLSRWEKKGDEVDAMDEACGYDALLLKAHLELDLAFAVAYRNTLQRMVKKMEGVMYRAGLEPTGKTDRAKWLAANCPEKYGAKITGNDDDAPRDVNPKQVVESKWSAMAKKALGVTDGGGRGTREGTDTGAV